jgi:hypothetical protein
LHCAVCASFLPLPAQVLTVPVSPKAAVAAAAEVNVEVLGDRVRCDFQYIELKISPGEYQVFKRRCMGPKWDGN